MFCQDAISKEMHRIIISFEILDHDIHVPVGWKEVTGDILFSVNMDFTRKACWGLYGHRTFYPEGSQYAGVVSG